MEIIKMTLIGTAVLLGVSLLVVLIPLVHIWALNTLFPALIIPYTFKTWAAVLILVSVLAGPKFIHESK